MVKSTELLKKLCTAFGPSGYEREVADIIKSEISGLCDRLSEDRLGNVYAYIDSSYRDDSYRDAEMGTVADKIDGNDVKKSSAGIKEKAAENIKVNLEENTKENAVESFFGADFFDKNGRAPRILIAAHMDEVGFLITGIDSDGNLQVHHLGGMDKRVLSGHKVTLRRYNGACGVKKTSSALDSEVLNTEKAASEALEKTTKNSDKAASEAVTGVILAKPVHLGSEIPDVDKMFIDIGADNKEDAEKYISEGDFAVFGTDFVEFGQDGRYIKSKAIDDRLGCAVMIETIKKLRELKIRPKCDLCFAFTVREEIGISGAGCAAFRFQPDAAVILESTAIADIADVDAHKKVADVGGGGVISIADRMTVYDIGFTRYILANAEKNGIKCQVKRYLSGGNDAGKIHISRDGVKCAVISAPCRYLHTSCNVIDKNDYFSISELVFSVIKDIG